MFSLTKQEQLLIAVILSAGILGGLVMIWRDTQQNAQNAGQPPEMTNHEED